MSEEPSNLSLDDSRSFSLNMTSSSSNTMALGEQVEESRGKITGQRVLSIKGIPKMETSFVMEGNYKGIPSTDIGTYATVLREGALHGKGQGVVTAKDGKGVYHKLGNSPKYRYTLLRFSRTSFNW